MGDNIKPGDKNTLNNWAETTLYCETHGYPCVKKLEWEIEERDVTLLEKTTGELFSVIIDKGCLDCILSDPKYGEEKFVKTLDFLVFSLVQNGIFYYFSNGKIENRINLFYRVPGIKYKVETIDMNLNLKEEFKEFNQNDNIYYLYIITKE